MAQTSIHFQPVKGGSEEHNQRTKKLDYVHHELSSQNDYWQSCSQESRLAFVAANAKAKTGRKMQAKATPIREAVVVIKDTTTMRDLKDLSKRLHDRFGIEVFQIAIHKDEGYKKSKDGIKLNLHAHLVADWTDHETGKSLKLNRQDMAEMQTICAEVLDMERGKSSEKQHLSAIQFKVKAEEERAEEAAENLEKIRSRASEIQTYGFQLKDENKALEKKISGLTDEKDRISAERDKVAAEAESLAKVVEAARSDLHGLEARKNAIEQEIQMKAQEKKEAEQAAEQAKAKAKQAETAALSGLVVGGTKKIGNLLGIGKEAKQLKELPQQLAAAREEGRTEGKKEVIAEVLKEAQLSFGEKEVTPSMIGRAWKKRFEESQILTERVKNLQNSDSYRDKLFQMLAEIPIIKQCLAIIRYFVAHDLRQFEREDIKPLQMALQGDESQASTLMQTARYGSIYNKPHLSDRWEKAESEMRKIARGENLEQNQERNQGLRWHR